jgi:acetyltransferase
MHRVGETEVKALEVLMVRFSALVAEQRWIKEIDINPLLASPDGLIALDARVVVHGAAVTLEQVPKAAIRPYPTRYVAPWTMKDGGCISIRPIRPEDEPCMVKFHETLSERTGRSCAAAPRRRRAGRWRSPTRRPRRRSLPGHG